MMLTGVMLAFLCSAGLGFGLDYFDSTFRSPDELKGILAIPVLWAATLIVFVFPFVFVRLMMMVGNWVQHAFIDPDHPDDPYKSSINTIEPRFNARVFNAGYHIFHHVRKGTHYAELATEFAQNREKYGREDAVVFDGIDLLGIWILLVTRQHRKLAKYFVRLPGAPARSNDEVIALLQRRLRPIRNWTPASGARVTAAPASSVA